MVHARCSKVLYKTYISLVLKIKLPSRQIGELDSAKLLGWQFGSLADRGTVSQDNLTWWTLKEAAD